LKKEHVISPKLYPQADRRFKAKTTSL